MQRHRPSRAECRRALSEPLAQRGELASALAYRGYAHRLVVGPGGHSLGQGGAMLEESLSWLWARGMSL